MSNITSRLVKNLPQWMKIHKDPDSVGAQFLNVFGIEMEEIESLLDEQLNNQFIGTANLGQIDILYRAHIHVNAQPTSSITIQGDGQLLVQAEDLRSFYESEIEHLAIVDHDKNLIYTKQIYGVLSVTVDGNQQTLPQVLHHVWNSFDEFGLLLSVPRLHGEINAAYKQRLLRVFSHPGSATSSGLQNYIGRRLGIAPHHVKLDMMQPAFVGSLLKDDGAASTQLKDIVRRIGEAAPVTWRNASWDQVYWITVEPNLLGLDYLPNIWDVTMDGWQDKDFKSGIGDGNDLQVQLPQYEKDEQTLDYFVGLHGAREDTEVVYVPHSFIYNIQATGIIPENIAPPEEYHYHIEAGEIVPLIFTVTAGKDYMQSLELDYSGVGYTISPDNSIEIIPGNQITSTDSSDVKLRVTLTTNDNTISPTISNLKLYWYDTSDALQEVEFDTKTNWEDNESILGVHILDTHELRLANTEFDVTIDTTAEWTEDHQESMNISIDNNSIKLMGVTE